MLAKEPLSPGCCASAAVRSQGWSPPSRQKALVSVGVKAAGRQGDWLGSPGESWAFLEQKSLPAEDGRHPAWRQAEGTFGSVGQESEPGRLLGSPLGSPLYHQRSRGLTPLPLHTTNLRGGRGLCAKVDTTRGPQGAGGAAGRSASSPEACPHPSAHSRPGVPLSCTGEAKWALISPHSCPRPCWSPRSCLPVPSLEAGETSWGGNPAPQGRIPCLPA